MKCAIILVWKKNSSPVTCNLEWQISLRLFLKLLFELEQTTKQFKKLFNSEWWSNWIWSQFPVKRKIISWICSQKKRASKWYGVSVRPFLKFPFFSLDPLDLQGNSFTLFITFFFDVFWWSFYFVRHHHHCHYYLFIIIFMNSKINFINPSQWR